MVNLKVMINKD